MTRQPMTTAPAPDADMQWAFDHSTTADLLTAIKALTHRIHEADQGAERLAALREQRALVEAEVLRRCGETV